MKRLTLDLDRRSSTYEHNSEYIAKECRADTILTIAHNLYRKGWLMRHETAQDVDGSDHVARIILVKGW